MSLHNTDTGRKLVKSTSGSTLTWVMIVSIVLTLLIVSILAIISYNFNATNLNRERTQAYYTAQSVNDRVVTWITGTPSPSSTLDPGARNYDEVKDPYNFVKDLMDKWPEPEIQHYTEDELGADLGSATTTVEFTSDRFDELKVTTSAEFADAKETLTTLMYLEKTTEFTSVNTGFDYSDPGIAAALSEIKDIPAWSDQALWTKEYTSGSWWSYFLNVYNDGIIDYRMDLLAVGPNDYTLNPDNLRHDYSYRYLQNNNFPTNVGKELVRIDLNPSRGAFFTKQLNASPASNIPDVVVGSANNPVINYPFPYNNGTLRPSVKGVLLTISGIGGPGTPYEVVHDKIVYYTLDHEGFSEENWPNLVLGTYYGSGSAPPSSPLTYRNLSLYLTDTSQKTLEINSGIVITSGTMYTKRSTHIGTVFVDTGQNATNSAIITNYSKNNDLVFQTYNFIFADPGEGETLRTSRISGTSYAGGTSKTTMNNGSILVQNNHELTIGDGAVINAQDNKGIVVESGGSLIIEAGANITGNIYVANGATLTINGYATIRGNVFCSGTMAINSSFILNNLDENQDNIDMGYVTSQNNNATGIFIYNDTHVGVGSLYITGNPIITSTAGVPTNKVQSFVPYPEYPGSLFCNHVDAERGNHVCNQWDSNTYVWVQRPGSTQEVY